MLSWGVSLNEESFLNKVTNKAVNQAKLELI